MKKFFFLTIVSVIFYITASAQKSEMSETTITSAEPPILNSLALQYATSDINESYRDSKKWKHAHTLRTAGVVITSVGGGIALLGASTMLSGVNDDSDTGFSNTFGGYFITVGGCCVAAVGAVAWIVGNSKMKKARLSYTGNGVAFKF